MNRVASSLSVFAVLVATASAQPISPYVDPPFTSQCVVHHFGEAEAPPLDGCPDDPFCVEYEKRDITASNGGAIRFLAAEPARFAVAVPKCRYWQQDHWRIQLAPGDPTILQWDGSYWFDKATATGAARLRDFTIGGQAGGPGQVADLIAPVDPDLAAVIRTYGEGDGGGGGSSFDLGVSDPTCPAPPAGNACYDDLALSRARAAAAARCDCAGARFHQDHVRCVAAVAGEEVAAGRLPAACRGLVVDCAKRSVCGRAGAVVCFRTSAGGRTRCAIRRDAGACRAPAGGAASVGGGWSCCDPRSVEGCS